MSHLAIQILPNNATGNDYKVRKLSELDDFAKSQTRLMWIGHECNSGFRNIPGLFHSLRADFRAKAYAQDLLFDYSQMNLNSSVEQGEEEDIEMREGQLLFDVRALLDSLTYLCERIEYEHVRDFIANVLEEFRNDVEKKKVDMLDRKIVKIAEFSLEILSKKFEADADDIHVLSDASFVVNILVIAEKIWFNLRGDVIPVVLMNSSQSTLRFHAVAFQNESVKKLKMLLSEALALDEDKLDIRLVNNYNNSPYLKLHDGFKLKKFLDNSQMNNTGNNMAPFSMQFRFRVITEEDMFFQTDHFMEDRLNDTLKPEMMSVLQEIFFTHAPSPALQEANKILLCLGLSKSKASPLKKFASSNLFDRNLLGMIFNYSDQKPVMNVDRLKKHILGCGISPNSTSASRDRVVSVMRSYGNPTNNGEYEMDFKGFVRFYTQAFLERPMLSWYDYLAFGFGHNFERDFRITPLCISLQNSLNCSEYHTYSLNDYLSASQDRKVEASSNDVLWITNRVDFTARGILEHPLVLKMLKQIASCSNLRDISSSVVEVLEYRKKNLELHGRSYASGKIAPIAALYL